MPELDPESIAAVRTLVELSGLLRELRRRDARQRAAREISYRQLAAKTGWSRTVIGGYLTGRTLPPACRFDAAALFRSGVLDDILLVISWTGQAPAWEPSH